MSNIFDIFKKIEKESAQVSTAPITHIIVGLGNTGKEYENTRHNIGFCAIDYVAQKCGANINKFKFEALVGEGMIAGKRVLLMKPQTLMNASGKAVAPAASFYKIPTENIIVLSDDINLTVDVLKGYIDAAEKRIEQELTLAHTIQDSALPKNFRFAHTGFEIYATMDPAKEVGGDFYDFFFVDADKIALVIADVSGKGIPAALFMMNTKVLLKSDHKGKKMKTILSSFFAGFRFKPEIEFVD